MGDTHSKSFFGQNTGLIVSSSSKTDPYFFIRCIKKKPGGSWEKPSSGEGKVVKCSLDEIVMILEVLIGLIIIPLKIKKHKYPSGGKMNKQKRCGLI